MTISLASSQVGTRQSSAGQSDSYTVPNVPSRILILFTAWYDTGGMTTRTYDGVTLDYLITQANSSVDPSRVYIYYMLSPPAGAHTIAYTMGSVYNNYCVQTWSGVNQNTPFGTPSIGIGNDQLITRTVSSAAGDVVIDNASFVTTPGRTITLGADQTSLYGENSGSEPILGYGGSYEAGAASVDMTWALEATAQWASAAVALKPAPGGSQGIMIWSKMQDFYDELKRGLIPSWDLQRQYKELYT